MKVYELYIKPRSGCGTPLKGDTIFGQFCWQLLYDERLAAVPFSDLVAQYAERPFVVFSSAYPAIRAGDSSRYAFRKPALPYQEFFDDGEDKRSLIKNRKLFRKKRWMLVEKNQRIESFRELEYMDDRSLMQKAFKGAVDIYRQHILSDEEPSLAASFPQPHNTVSRMTGTTGEGPFSPYMIEQTVFHPAIELVLFVGVEEEMISIDGICRGLQRIGDTGFGKDASTGLGRFSVGDVHEADLSGFGPESPTACYTLGPCVPEKNGFEKMNFVPFTRFGRHGDRLAKAVNPFKNPVIMADEAGVFTPKEKDVFKTPYIGRAVLNVSKAEPKTVTQGYSLYLPVTVEE